jgi:cytidylate kinase
MTVITLSRQIGSRAPEVAARLCAELGLRAFDRRVIAEVAADLGLAESEIVDYSEDAYKLRSFLDDLFRRSRPVAEVTTWAGGRAMAVERQVRVLDEGPAVDLIRATIKAAYERGNYLIIGRGGQAVLEGKPGVFHVRLVSPFEERVYQLQTEQHLTAAQARRHIQERDQATREYLETFYDLDVDDATLYHMLLNTGRLGVERCVALIKAGIQEQTLVAGA